MPWQELVRAIVYCQYGVSFCDTVQPCKGTANVLPVPVGIHSGKPDIENQRVEIVYIHNAAKVSMIF